MSKENDTAALEQKAKNLVAQGKYAEAEPNFRKAIELDPTDAHYHSNLGICLVWQGKFAEVEACYRKAVELDPTKAAYKMLLNECLKAQGKPTE